MGLDQDLATDALCKLVDRARRGDGIALDRVLELYYRPVHVYLSRRVSDPMLAEDLTQEVCLNVVEGIRSLNDPKAFLAWVLRIADRTLAKEWRRKRIDIQSLDERHEQFADPHHQWQTIEAYVLFESLLATLPPALHLVVFLKVSRGWSSSTIAGELGISNAAAERRLSRARLSLRHMLETQDDRACAD